MTLNIPRRFSFQGSNLTWKSYNILLPLFLHIFGTSIKPYPDGMESTYYPHQLDHVLLHCKLPIIKESRSHTNYCFSPNKLHQDVHYYLYFSHSFAHLHSSVTNISLFHFPLIELLATCKKA